MTMAFICWESWLTLPVNCLDMFRNGTRMLTLNAAPEMLTFGMFASRNTPPTRARVTYRTLPMLPMMGPRMFA